MEAVRGETGQAGRRLAVFVAIVIANTLLSAFAVVGAGIAPGIASFYLAVGFMIAFALWFGGWGVLAAYLGCILGAGLVAGVPGWLNPVWSLADLWQVLIPLAAFRAFHADVGLSTRRDFGIFLAFGWFANNLAGAAWGSVTLALGGVIPWGGVEAAFVSWLAGNLFMTMIITTLLLVFVTPRVREAGILVTGTWA
ncbi:MAG TPA: hypothetical protein VKO45_08705 [Methanomicrobiales archaeon]|nr:hypothetical protein [Methanomicrobiales archaeon]